MMFKIHFDVFSFVLSAYFFAPMYLAYFVFLFRSKIVN